MSNVTTNGRSLADALRAFHQGEDAALADVAEHVQRIARRCAYRYGLAEQDAEDAAGDVVATLLERRAEAHVASFVWQRLNGAMIDLLRKRGRGAQPSPDDEPWAPARSKHLPPPDEPREPDEPAPDLESVIEDLRELARTVAKGLRGNDGPQLLETLDGLVEVWVRRSFTQAELAVQRGVTLNGLQARETRVRKRLLERCKSLRTSAPPEEAERHARVERLILQLAGHQ